MRDRRLAKIVRRCQELPGEELFQYLDKDDRVVDVTSTAVNDYRRDRSAIEATAKDFRTWGGTVVAAMTLVALDTPETDRQADQQFLAACEAAAARLGNTRTVCRSSHVHPLVANAHKNGELVEAWRKSRDRPRFSRGEASVARLLN